MNWSFIASDIDAVRRLIEARQSDAFYQLRKKRNVDRDRPPQTQHMARLLVPLQRTVTGL